MPSGTPPPRSAHSSTARAAGTSTGASADSKPRSRTAEPSVTPAARAASPGSSTRQLVGHSPAWTTALAAAAPATKLGKRAVADARNRGRSWRRSHASVITPNEPSEPSSRRSGDGPAPEPGSRRDSREPLGVIARIDSTKSSTWVNRVA
jgi:hypothetical protein